MQPIVYDVAVSIDGFISGVGGDISAFPGEGAIVSDYLARVATYRTVIMGRATYEFGYRFGLQAGKNPYPHARTIVVSTSLDLGPAAEVEVWRALDPQRIDALRVESAGAIYLCGGGVLAGHLLDMGRIARLRLKRVPILLGGGTELFAGIAVPPALRFLSQTDYESGVLFQEFEILGGADES